MLITGIKTPAEVRIGDTATRAKSGGEEPLFGFQEVKPMVFGGLQPVNADDYENLKTALEKLQQDDASLVDEPETSVALGFGFRCGWLGFLDGDIVRERRERGYGLELIATAATVRYRVVHRSGAQVEIESPAALPPVAEIEWIEEPVILATVHVPPEYVGSVLALCRERRGRRREMARHGSRVELRCEVPLAEVVFDFPIASRAQAAGTAPSTTTGSAASPRGWSGWTC